ncbi:MAG: GDP-L-fucose synthase [Selenomonadaceae bacterium]|nr:GDP-L-fucose synthase [Selenomonadaceae bacterium]
MKVLIAGSTGLVGSAVVESMQKTNHELLTPKHSELDLLDRDAVRKYLRAQNPDLVIHCAGIVGGIMINRKEQVRFMLENLDMGKNLIHESFLAGVKRFINLGSSCMYPRNSEKPLAEDMILTGELEPTNEGYAIAKIACERLCEFISRENPAFQYKTIIPNNLYGKNDKFKTENAHMLPAVIHKIHVAKMNGQSSIEIWGTGQVRREFFYSGDFGDLISYCVENFDRLPSVMNAGTGIDFTIDQYYQAVAKVVGYEGQFTHDTSKPEGMTRKLLDVSKLKEFGWTAKTDLETGIRKTYEFYLEHEI